MGTPRLGRPCPASSLFPRAPRPPLAVIGPFLQPTFLYGGGEPTPAAPQQATSITTGQ
jgi:hypothetical protein